MLLFFVDKVKNLCYYAVKELDYEIKRCLDNKEKMILLQNRRGYSPYVSCRKCGYTFKCAHCELSMSYHKNGDKFKCHYCNNEVKFNHKCPKCENELPDNAKFCSNCGYKFEIESNSTSNLLIIMLYLFTKPKITT